MPKPMTIKEVAQKIGVSFDTVKSNIVDLLELLPVKDRMAVLEYMAYCQQLRRGQGTVQEYVFKRMWGDGDLIEGA